MDLTGQLSNPSQRLKKQLEVLSCRTSAFSLTTLPLMRRRDVADSGEATSTSRLRLPDVAREATASPGIPPAPSVKARLEGRKVVIDYSFKTFPMQRSRRPWMLLTSVVSSSTGYAPYTVRNLIKARTGRVIQSRGPGRGPYKLRVATLSAVGTRSKIIELRLK
jgi:hypothetical protein